MTWRLATELAATPNFPALVFPAKEAVTQLASMNMVTIRLLPFLAIPAQAGTHASTST
jgi:hypothetical protein